MNYQTALDNISSLVTIDDGYNGAKATVGLALVDNVVYEVSAYGCHKSPVFKPDHIQDNQKYGSLYRHYFKSVVVYKNSDNSVICELQDIRNFMRLNFSKYYALPVLMHLQNLNK